ncbi:MAG: electron transfer flavoprotein alpha subunit [Saprospiraceae bacterium]|jgi:electron transfer flavoprotein alpha subunit
MSVLVVAEHNNSELNGMTLSAISAASQLGDADVHVLVAGSDCAAVAHEAASAAGVSKVLHADDASLATGIAENMASLVRGIAGDYGHILAVATASGKNWMPRVAAKLDVQQISDISAVVSPDTFQRPIYAGNAIATVQSTDATKLITVRSTSFEALEGSNSAAVESIAAEAAFVGSQFVSEQIGQSDRPDLVSAKIVVSGGRGMGSEENFKILDPLAEKLGAAIGASRAAVDAGYAPNELQVGQTGKVVAPDVYIAFGISGAIQHLAGMKESKIIVAVNTDEDAPIFQVANYGLVADLFDVIPALEAAL